ncbi:MAG: hypothetical protein ACKV0T_02805 [Planctomycetales bacterium]
MIPRPCLLGFALVVALVARVEAGMLGSAALDNLQDYIDAGATTVGDLTYSGFVYTPANSGIAANAIAVNQVANGLEFVLNFFEASQAGINKSLTISYKVAAPRGIHGVRLQMSGAAQEIGTSATVTKTITNPNVVLNTFVTTANMDGAATMSKLSDFGEIPGSPKMIEVTDTAQILADARGGNTIPRPSVTSMTNTFTVPEPRLAAVFLAVSIGALCRRARRQEPVPTQTSDAAMR